MACLGARSRNNFFSGMRRHGAFVLLATATTANGSSYSSNCQLARGRYVHISSQRQRNVEFWCDLVGEWDERRVERAGDNRRERKIHCASRLAKSQYDHSQSNKRRRFFGGGNERCNSNESDSGGQRDQSNDHKYRKFFADSERQQICEWRAGAAEWQCGFNDGKLFDTTHRDWKYCECGDLFDQRAESRSGQQHFAEC